MAINRVTGNRKPAVPSGDLTKGMQKMSLVSAYASLEEEKTEDTNTQPMGTSAAGAGIRVGRLDKGSSS